MPVIVSDANFDAEVMKANKVIVDFWADWCGPCKMLGPRFEELSKEMPDIKFCKLNVDENENTAVKLEIRNLPTLIMFEKGQITGKIIGAMSKDAMKEKINQAFSK
jgi:thioredoxin 1